MSRQTPEIVPSSHKNLIKWLEKHQILSFLFPSTLFVVEFLSRVCSYIINIIFSVSVYSVHIWISLEFFLHIIKKKLCSSCVWPQKKGQKWVVLGFTWTANKIYGTQLQERGRFGSRILSSSVSYREKKNKEESVRGGGKRRENPTQHVCMITIYVTCYNLFKRHNL